MAISNASEAAALSASPPPSVRRNIIANYLGNAWSAVMGLAFVPLYIHYLGMEAYGLIGIFALLQAWMSVLDMGLTPMLTREMARLTAGAHTPQSIRDLLRSVELIYAAVAVAIAMGIAAAAPWLSAHWLRAEHLPDASIAQALAIAGVVIALRWLNGLYRGAINGLQDQVWLNGCTALFATVRGIGAVMVLALIAPRIQIFFIFQGVVVAMETAVLALHMHRLLPPSRRPARFDWRALRPVRHFAGGMAMITVLSLLLSHVDKLILSRMLPLSEFGYYTLATTLCGALYLMIAPIHNATYPRLTALVGAGDAVALRETYHRFAQILTMMIAPAAIVLCLFAEDILLLWTRNAAIAVSTAPLVSILAVGTLCNGLMHTPYALQLAHGRTRFTVVVNLFAVCILVPSLYIGISVYGTVAAAIVWAVLNVAYVILTAPVLHRRWLPGELWRWYVHDSLVPASAVFVVVSFIRLIAPAPSMEQPLQNASVILFAAVVAQTTCLLATPASRATLAHYRHMRFLTI
jgi:O-antigen/teichoic acid export membrane protein